MRTEPHRLVYVSRRRTACGGEARAELASILEASRRRNRLNGLSGVLLYTGRGFAQVLEGNLDALEPTFERIQNDDRHHAVNLLSFAPVGERVFAEWSMGFVGQRSGFWLSAAAPSALDDVLARFDDLDVLLRLRRTLREDERASIAGCARRLGHPQAASA